MMTWENYCFKRAVEFRSKEINILKKNNILIGIFMTLLSSTPFLSFITMFAVQFALGYSLNVASVNALLKILRIYMIGFFGIPFFITKLFEFYVSTKRIDNFLRSDQIDNDYIKRIPMENYNENKNDYS